MVSYLPTEDIPAVLSDKIDGVVNWTIANWVDWKGTGQWGKNRVSAWL